GVEIAGEIVDREAASRAVQLRRALEAAKLDRSAGSPDVDGGLERDLDRDLHPPAPALEEDPPVAVLRRHDDLAGLLVERETETILEVLPRGNEQHVGAGSCPAADDDAADVAVEPEPSAGLEAEVALDPGIGRRRPCQRRGEKQHRKESGESVPH